MSKWRSATIAELTARTSSGGTPSRTRADYFAETPDGIPWVRSQELIDRRIKAVGEHITQEGLKNSSAKLFPPDTVLVAMYGATVGQLGYLDIFATTNQAICALITDPEVTCPRFLYYSLMGARHHLVSQAQGAAQQNLSQAQIREFELTVPDLPTQRAIASVLGSIDDLIENNRRRIELLEEMAQAIYREWFVHFRFPGHEDATFVDSPLGPIPEGWEAATLGDTSINFDKLRKPMSKMERESRRGPFPYYGAAKLIDWVDDWIFDGEYLLFAEDGSVQTPEGFPVLQLIDCKFWPNNHTHILQGRGASTRFLYLASQLQPISAFVTGAAQPKITQHNLNRIPLVRPRPSVLHDFDTVTDPVFDQWRSLQEQCTPLIKIRDLLLPKLVTGEIDVSELDLDVLAEAVS